jgi:hypothetical protein
VTQLVEVEAEVVRVVPGGFEDHLEGGATVRRDQSVAHVTAPPELAGRTLRIVVDDPAADALLREGAVAFDVDPSDLELDTLFSGALANVRRLAEPAR